MQRAWNRPCRVIAVITVIGLVGCRNSADRASEPPSPPTTMSPAPRGAHDTSDFVGRQLELRGAQFGGSMVLAEPVVRGILVQGASASHDLVVMGGHCYRIMAVGGVEVNDIDLVLYGPDGTQIDSDTQGESYPVLGGTRPFCPPTGGRYRVDVRMHNGQGEYGLEVFRTP